VRVFVTAHGTLLCGRCGARERDAPARALAAAADDGGGGEDALAGRRRRRAVAETTAAAAAPATAAIPLARHGGLAARSLYHDAARGRCARVSVLAI